MTKWIKKPRRKGGACSLEERPPGNSEGSRCTRDATNSFGSLVITRLKKKERRSLYALPETGLSVVMPALVAGIHVFAKKQGVDGRDIRAFTPVFDGLCPAMTAC
jgi:hypothetical protein